MAASSGAKIAIMARRAAASGSISYQACIMMRMAHRSGMAALQAAMWRKQRSGSIIWRISSEK